MRFARWAVIALFLTLGCQGQTPRIKVERVEPPPSADLVDLVARGGEGEPVALARSANFLWIRNGEWRATRPFDGGAFHRDETALRDTMIWARGSWWWLEVPDSGTPVLRRSANGREWEDFELPGSARTPSSLADGNAVPTAHLALETENDGVYLVGPARIWRLDPSGEPVWHRVDLDGVGDIEAGGEFPAFIRNFLPRTEERPYELLTTFGRQLKVYRRDAPDAPWMMVASLGTIDLELTSSADGSTVFIASPDGLRRSSDDGETWFRFWPKEAKEMSAMALVADNTGQLGYAVLAGTTNGAILRSIDQGSTWETVRPGGPDRRAVSAFAVARDGITVRAASRGRGVWVSEDGGRSWRPDNGALRGARPRGVELSENGRLIVANPGGVWELTGNAGSGEWTELNARRAAALLAGRGGTVVTGTAEGSVLVQSSPDDVVEVDSLFRDGEGPAVEPAVESSMLSNRAVVLVRQRPQSETLQAWSKGNGAAYSVDGGSGWQALPLDRSLIDALSDSKVVDVQLDANRGIYLSARRESGEVVLWYSPDDGLTWRAVREISGNRARFLVLDPADGSAVIAISDEGIERSLDRGTTWKKLDGPWDGLDVVGAAHRPGRLLLLVDSRPGFEVMLLDNPSGEGLRPSRFLLNWPAEVPSEPPREIELVGESIALMGEGATWRASIPGAESPVPVAVTFVATALGIVVVSAFAFFFLRRA